MKSTQLKEHLQGLLYEALKEYINIKLIELPKEKIYAVSLYCDSGFRSMGGAISTVESLNERINDNSSKQEILNFELYASEWKYVNDHYQIFEKVDEFIDKTYEVFYDGEFDDVDLEEFDDDQLWDFTSSFFIETIVMKMNKLKDEKKFDNESFTRDVFLGIQFGDPSEEDLKMLLTVSERLNSPDWHNKLLQSLN